jgi:hypothetical protein
MNTKPYVEVWERVSVQHQRWERSFDKGKTWESVDWSMYPEFPFCSIDPDAAPWVGARMITEAERDVLYPGKGDSR